MKPIRFSPPDITALEIEEVAAALNSGWITTGPRTKELERRIAQRVGTPKAVCLNSATAALETTLRVLGIGPGDEVITSAYTYTASASVVHHLGAKLVLVDTAQNSFEKVYEKLAEAITEKTKVVIPVDLAGNMCDYDSVFAAVSAKKHLFSANNKLQEAFGRVIVVADSAHGFGAVSRFGTSGQAADFTTFSFHAVKNLTTAEGGAVAWKDREGLDHEELYREYMLWSLHGQSKDALAKTKIGMWEYDIKVLGYKCNMTDIAAAIGLKQLDRYDGMLARRQEIIAQYTAALAPHGLITPIHVTETSRSSGHLYLLRIPGYTEEERNDLICRMAECEVPTNVHYKPLPMMTAYKNLGFSIEKFPNAYTQYQNEITLPLHTLLDDEDVSFIAETLIDCWRK